MDKQKIGEFIARKRKEAGYTQKELAEKLMITDRAISKWERGICCPDISLLSNLSKILNVSVNELLLGEDIKEFDLKTSDDILVHSVQSYNALEKKKNRRLLIFTIVLLVFYVFLVFGMYLTFNQVNKTDGLTWETLQNKRLSEKFYTALENLDYEVLRNMVRSSYGGYKESVPDFMIEDENKCIEPHQSWGLVCRLKDLDNEGVKFVSHKFIQHFYGGNGAFGVQYEVVLNYKGEEIIMDNITYGHNGVIDEIMIGWKEFPELWGVKNPIVNKKIELFFSDDVYDWE